MRSVHLGELDLNQLPVLAVLLETRQVTRAAQRLGLSQSATSHALARLREVFGDPLLVRGPEGLVLTRRAEALQQPLREALDRLEGAVFAPAPFDPARAERTFSVAAADYLEIELAPNLLRRTRAEAPGIQLWFRSFGDEALKSLADGTLDLLIAPPRPELDRPGLRTRQLFEDNFVSLVRPGHPALKRRWTPELFAELPHAFVAPRGRPGGAVDVALDKLGLTRKVVFATPHFLVAPLVIAESDLVLTIPRRMAAALEGRLGLVQVEPPVELPNFPVAMFWHERSHGEGAHVWLREAVVAASEVRRAPRPRRPRRAPERGR